MSFSRFRLPRTAPVRHTCSYSPSALYLLYSFYVYCERIVRSWELIAPNATLFFFETGLPRGWCFYYKDVSGLRKYLRMLRKCALMMYVSRLRLNASVICWYIRGGWSMKMSFALCYCVPCLILLRYNILIQFFSWLLSRVLRKKILDVTSSM